MKFTFIVTTVLLFTFSCMPTPIRYEYADGSANLYLLTESTLEYVPVKPEESSTGFYSGGEPKKVTLTAQQFVELSRVLEKALNNTSIHIQDRIKTSGMISAIGSDKRQCIIKPGSNEMLEIENTLKKVLK
jgi:hypothetical protein